MRSETAVQDKTKRKRCFGPPATTIDSGAIILFSIPFVRVVFHPRGVGTGMSRRSLQSYGGVHERS